MCESRGMAEFVRGVGGRFICCQICKEETFLNDKGQLWLKDYVLVLSQLYPGLHCLDLVLFQFGPVLVTI